WQAMAGRLPERKKVAVSVAPTFEELKTWRDAGLDAFQIHFPLDTSVDIVAEWSELVGPDRLWLAPKLPPGSTLPSALLQYAKTVLVDTFAKDVYGGSGIAGDWDAFRALRETHPDHTWILAGGLSPANITEALAASGARFVDLSSGVEAAPGIKDPAKLRAFVLALHRARRPGADPSHP
ncbi:MAG: phosphoribosylanthranilate isomerase, partial [Opitutaceae bacterium]